MMGKNKKGISPVIATVLLITISIILIAIIFIWARGSITETKVKFGEDVKNVCTEVSLEPNLVNSNLDIVNTGSRAGVSGVALRTSNGDLQECIFDDAITPGKSISINT